MDAGASAQGFVPATLPTGNRGFDAITEGLTHLIKGRFDPEPAERLGKLLGVPADVLTPNGVD